MERMNRIEGIQERSESTKQLINRFIAEFEKAQSQAGNGQPQSRRIVPQNKNPHGFMVMIQELLRLSDITPELLADAILPLSLLAKKKKEIDHDSKLKIHFPEGYRVQPAVLPFTYYGHDLTDQEIAEGGHVTELVREEFGEKRREEERTVIGFSQFPSYVHKLYPELFQGCSFIVPKYKSDDLYEVSQTERDLIKELYEQEFNKLREAIKELAARNYQ